MNHAADSSIVVDCSQFVTLSDLQHEPHQVRKFLLDKLGRRIRELNDLVLNLKACQVSLRGNSDRPNCPSLSSIELAQLCGINASIVCAVDPDNSQDIQSLGLHRIELYSTSPDPIVKMKKVISNETDSSTASKSAENEVAVNMDTSSLDLQDVANDPFNQSMSTNSTISNSNVAVDKASNGVSRPELTAAGPCSQSNMLLPCTVKLGVRCTEVDEMKRMLNLTSDLHSSELKNKIVSGRHQIILQENHDDTDDSEWLTDGEDECQDERQVRKNRDGNRRHVGTRKAKLPSESDQDMREIDQALRTDIRKELDFRSSGSKDVRSSKSKASGLPYDGPENDSLPGSGPDIFDNSAIDLDDPELPDDSNLVFEPTKSRKETKTNRGGRGIDTEEKKSSRKSGNRKNEQTDQSDENEDENEMIDLSRNSDDYDQEEDSLLNRARKLANSGTRITDSDSGTNGSIRIRRRRIRKGANKKRRHRISSSSSFNDDDSDSDVDIRRSNHRKPPPRKLCRIKVDSESDNPDETIRIKPIMSKDKLRKDTINAEKSERERRKRLEKKQLEFNGIEMTDDTDLATALSGSQTAKKRITAVCLDPDSQSDQPTPVELHPSLVRVLKPHQASGVQFLYNSAIEEIGREDGGGAILAHCMGLGKTLQVIAFLHTVMLHEKLGEKIKKVLVVVPKNVVLNWKAEFNKWLDENDDDLARIVVLELDGYKQHHTRLKALQQWQRLKQPAVMLIGYDMFRILTADDHEKMGGNKKKLTKIQKTLVKLQPDLRKCLQDPGADLVVCDEAHRLKNNESALSRSMNKIRTKRRLCLTGTPMQNNLLEYHCMVDFVRPGLLGTKKEFSNRFANAIKAGRLRDATLGEVKLMKRRCHVLYKKLDKVIDRKDLQYLRESIPPKQEYTLHVRMTDRQCQLYETFLSGIGLDNIGGSLNKRLLPDYHILARIWTHPYQLIAHEKVQMRKNIFKEDQDFVVSDGESIIVDSSSVEDSNVDSANEVNDDSVGPNRISRRLAGEQPEEDGRETPLEMQGWFKNLDLISEDDRYKVDLSNKLLLLLGIIKKCEEIGDKLSVIGSKLVFSQSLESLELIKRMLIYQSTNGLWFEDGHEALKADGEMWGWEKNMDFLEFTGATSSADRQLVQNSFNDLDNLRARLLLISTKAGSLGINLVSANRVVIFDACWNPSHDTQALFRVYRFGQQKPVYIYRMIAQGTMEERIYKRQVTKESTAMRVIDEAAIERHFTGNDLYELYRFDPDRIDSSNSQNSRPSFAPPKDRLLADLILKYAESFVSFKEHDSLFAFAEDEKLTQEECEEAWDEYEKERELGLAGPSVGWANQINQFDQNAMEQLAWNMQMQQQQQNMEVNVAALRQSIHSDQLFLALHSLRGIDEISATQITEVKIFLNALLPLIPNEIRGGFSNFHQHFIDFIDTLGPSGHVLEMKLKCGNTLALVYNLVREDPTMAYRFEQFFAGRPNTRQLMFQAMARQSTIDDSVNRNHPVSQ